MFDVAGIVTGGGSPDWLAPMLGFPQVTLPLAKVEGCPMGLSLLGPPGGDAMLLAAAAQMR